MSIARAIATGDATLLPGRRDEDWRWTDLRGLIRQIPRPSGEAFTAYSFPSKNLEYMVSGTPVLTTKLSGMPREYDDYAYLFTDESVEGMAQTLEETLALPRETLHEKGQQAKAFVLANKSNRAQAKRVLALLFSLDPMHFGAKK